MTGAGDGNGGGAAARRRAVLSVSRKDGLVDFARGLVGRGFEIVASGGTARAVREAGIAATDVANATGHPEILDGRVKTLHPAIHGGILARRDRSGDMASLDVHGIVPVDVVAVNFYPFERAAASGAPLPALLEEIDIGGPSLVRAAAKNWPDVFVVVDPGDYDEVLDGLDAPGDAARDLRRRLAARAFAATSAYEAGISEAFAGAETTEENFPERVTLRFERVQELRYGENPHQSAALYREAAGEPLGILGARKLHGKDLSYNNVLDLDAAVRATADLAAGEDGAGAAAVIVKHLNPAGAAVAETIENAYVAARATDPISAFGGIVALSRPVDAATAAELGKTFLEAVAAPGFEEAALRRLRRKKNLRLLEIADPATLRPRGRHFARVFGGLLVQDWDHGPDGGEERVATARPPTPEEWSGLRFAWTVVRHVKSNAIVLARGSRLLGVGAGQMSRLDSCRIAISKACSPTEGSVAASDAFFPFRDGLDTLAEAGVTAVVQPGGSVRDEEVIAAADERGIAMVLTGARRFRH